MDEEIVLKKSNYIFLNLLCYSNINLKKNKKGLLSKLKKMTVLVLHIIK